MPDQLNELTPATGYQKFLEELHLPKLLAGNAGSAISRLIGAGVDIPSAWLQGVSEGIRDKTAGRSLVTKALAQQTADIAVSDPALLERAKEAFVSGLMTKQANRETIASKTLDELGREDIPGDTPIVDPDWMNTFSSKSELASSENIQNMWARILAGEIRKPGKFSLSTLRFISELDKETAAHFEKLSPYVFNRGLAGVEKSLFPSILALADTGIISSHSPLLLTLANNTARYETLVGNGMAIVILKEADDKKIEISNVYPLTRVGRDLSKIVRIDTTKEILEEIVPHIGKLGVTKIFWGRTVTTHDQSQSIKAEADLWTQTED